MCLAVAGLVLAVEDNEGCVLVDGRERNVSFIALPDAEPGDYVLVSLGMAMELITEDEAREINETWAAISEIDAPGTQQGIGDD